eukprot:COSAG06_NODE_8606_length_2113_cov_1.510406_1_plen_174_part_00
MAVGAVGAAAAGVAAQDGETCAISAAAMSAPSLPTPGKTLVSLFPTLILTHPTVYTKDASSFSQDRLGTNTRKRSIYRDRLGTNIGKLNKMGVFPQHRLPFQPLRRMLRDKRCPDKTIICFLCYQFPDLRMFEKGNQFAKTGSGPTNVLQREKLTRNACWWNTKAPRRTTRRR